MSARTLPSTLLVALAGAVTAAVFHVPREPVAAAVLQEGSPPTKEPGQNVGGKASSPASPRQFPTARILLQHFLGSSRERDPYDLAVGTLIATVPDPTDSHMDWAFDSYLESIRRAYETRDYVLDSFWVPWSEKNDTLLVEGAGAAGIRVREEYPGVMLFRRSYIPKPDSGAVVQLDKSAKRGGITAEMRETLRRSAARVTPDTARALQVVFLVGEVPTAGIHKGAMLRALLARDSLPTDSADTVRIVGPSFSGSATSLAWALREWRASAERRPGNPPVRIVSGAATVGKNAALFREGAGGPGVQLRATVNTDATLQRVLLESVLCPLRVRADQVLILRESGTYGHDAAGPSSVTCPDRRRLTSAGFLQIPFPMNVAGLRAEYEAHPRAAAEGDEAGPARSRTRLSLRDPDRPMEHLPSTSNLTAPTLEVLMDEIEDAAATHDIRVVGILASDVRDKLFLVEELRDRLHDAQFFTFEGNALFLAPDKNPSFRGMLVLSSYPLSLQNQWWTGGSGGQRIPFASEGAEGVYNAVLLQLGAPGKLSEYQLPLGPARRAAPPVWVSAVGSRSFVPLLARPAEDSDHVAAGVLSSPAVQRSPGVGIFTAFSVLLLAAGLLYASAGVLGGAEIPRTVDATMDAALGDRVRWGSQVLHRHVYALLRLLALLGVFVPISVLVFTAVARDGGSLLGLLLRAGVCHALALACVLVAAWELSGLQERTEDATGVEAGMRPAVPRAPELAGGTRVEMLALAAAVTLSFAMAAMPWMGDVLAGTRTRWGVYVLFISAAVGGGAALSHAWMAVRHGLALFPAGWAYARSASWEDDSGGRSLWLGEVAGRTLVVVVGLVYFYLSMTFTTGLVHATATREYPLLLMRLGTLDSGVSPLLPLVLAGAGFAVWCTWHLSRIALLRHRTPFEAACWEAGARGTAGGAPAFMVEVGSRVGAVRSRLFLLVPSRSGVPVLLLVLLLAWVLGLHFSPTLEALVGLGEFTWLLRLAVVGGLVSTTWAVVRLLALWRGLRRVLDTVGETPLLPAFSRLPHSAAQLTRLTLWLGTRCDTVVTLALGQWRQLRTIYHAGKAYRDPNLSVAARRRVAAFMRNAPDEPPRRAERRLSDEPPSLFRDIWGVLEALWATEPDTDAVTKAPELLKGSERRDTASVFRQQFGAGARLWLRAAEEFAAVQFVDWVEWVLQQMRMLAVFLFVTLLVTTALISSYPFQPQSTVKLVFGAVLIGTVGALLYVMVMMNRNEVLSHIADTDPGRVSWDWSFALNVGLVAVVPLLTLVSSEVPWLHGALFSWISPVLKAITHAG